MAQADTTTTISTTASNGKNPLQQSTSINASQVVGNYSTNVTVQPYIAPQVISFYATDMRPGQRVYIFFDGVNVSQYCAPGIQLQGGEWDTSHYMNVRTGKWGDPIYVTDTGFVWGQFNIPEGVFKTGNRVLEIADVDNLNDSAKILSATTVAAATFVAGNLSVARSIDTPTTITPDNNLLPFTTSVVDPTKTIDLVRFGNITDYFNEFAAQSFTIPDNLGTPGVFVTSVDLFFRHIPSNTNANNERVTVRICEIKDGYPDETTMLPFARASMPRYYNNSSGDRSSILTPINVSSDSSAATTFIFDSPVYCQAGKQYAFIVRVDQNNPDFWLWTNNQGNKDILTGQVASGYPNIGGYLYYGYNGQRGFKIGRSHV